MKTKERPELYESQLLDSFLDMISEEEQYLTDVKMLIANKIAKILERRGIQKKQFAQMMGVKPSVVSLWLSGTHNFTLETLAKIEYALGIKLLDTKVLAMV